MFIDKFLLTIILTCNIIVLSININFLTLRQILSNLNLSVLKRRNEHMNGFINELVGAIAQVLVFSLIPFIWWLITARKKESFFSWIGLKRIEHKGSAVITILVSAAVFLAYGLATGFFTGLFSGVITSAGNQFTGMGNSYIPVAIIYGFVRTGLSEEIVFRGFLLKRIANKFGFAAGNTIQALLFGLMHGIPFGLISGNILVAVIFTLLPGCVGFYMGWVNEKKCGGSVIPGWLMHGFTNAIVTCMSL